ncbi:hypothetical protein DH2020_015311 [Rehmannia glutinosa]|uniref:Homeobox-leucine zipper protein n=1 Tax=Rehmannia glutinosa TaxID=99300 RepID=A0ABR0WVW8_REHGL
MYTRDFQTILDGYDEEGCVEEIGQVSEKKRRLSVDQVKALEKNFEVENKLEPERKVKLAQELGLQPRQVAVWFQNRRARYKTKQLERDYGILKANHDALKHKYETLQRENESLTNEIREMKLKLNEDDKTDSKISVKEEPLVSDTEGKSKLDEIPINSLAKYDDADFEFNFENPNGNKNEVIGSVFCDFKDGSSDDSDSSAILNEDINSPIAAISSSVGILHNSPHQFLEIQNGPKSCSSMDINNFQFSESKAGCASMIGDAHKAHQLQFVKIEEHNFFGEESCSTLFSDDQAPTLHWYCSDEWN